MPRAKVNGAEIYYEESRKWASHYPVGGRT